MGTRSLDNHLVCHALDDLAFDMHTRFLETFDNAANQEPGFAFFFFKRLVTQPLGPSARDLKNIEHDEIRIKFLCKLSSYIGRMIRTIRTVISEQNVFKHDAPLFR